MTTVLSANNVGLSHGVIKEKLKETPGLVRGIQLIDDLKLLQRYWSLKEGPKIQEDGEKYLSSKILLSGRILNNKNWRRRCIQEYERK